MNGGSFRDFNNMIESEQDQDQDTLIAAQNDSSMVKESSRNVTNTPSHTATEDVNTHEPSREEIRGEMIDYCYRSEVQNKKSN
jgi:hypothetical protein